MLTLHYLPVCPSCRSVLMLAHELDLIMELKPVDLQAKEHLTPDFLSMNPAHTVPVLQDDATGLTLFESRAIMCYLVDKYAPDHALYPQDLVKRAAIHKWLYFDCGTLIPSSRPLLKHVLGKGDAVPDAANQLAESLRIVEQMLVDQGTKYVTGDQMTIADLDLLIAIDFPVVLADVSLTPYPSLDKWFSIMTTELTCYEDISGQRIRKLKQKLSPA